LQSCIVNLAGRGIQWLADTSPGLRSAVFVQCSSLNERLRLLHRTTVLPRGLRPLPARRWLLSLLQLLLLLLMPLLQLLGLLLVSLLHLLLSRFIGMLLGQALMFLILLLLEFLPLLFLLSEYLFLLLLVFPVQLWVACVWSAGSIRSR
jgi:hypothetical protein